MYMGNTTDEVQALPFISVHLSLSAENMSYRTQPKCEKIVLSTQCSCHSELINAVPLPDLLLAI